MVKNGLLDGIRVIVRHDDDGTEIREVRGLDYDTTYARALDVMNGVVLERGPYIAGTWRDIESGEVVVRVTVRAARD